MGFSDIGCYGSEIATPNVDRLACEGLRFTSFYANPRSCPTRASLMTGMYPTKAGIGQMSENYGLPEYQGYLRRDCMTVAEVLKANGYGTYMAGKWHLGSKTGQWPTDRGFDRFWGYLGGATDYYEPGNGIVEDRTRIKISDPEFYMTDAISDRAVEFVRDAGNRKEPFFLYVAYTAPHWPLQAPQEVIDRYVEHYRAGWDEIRRRRFEKQLSEQLFATGTELSARTDDLPAWESLSETEQEVWSLKMAIYAAMIEIMDCGIGRIMEQVQQSGLDEKTVVIFLADNGACPFPVNYKKSAPGSTMGGKGSAVSYGYPWANASATPYRYFKRWTYEGGINVPCIVRWPGRVAAGSKSDVMAHVMDLLPTFIDICNGVRPDAFNGMAQLKIDGRSLVKVWQGCNAPIHDRLCWEHHGNRCIRKGDWKLLFNSDGEDRDWELYNLREDRTEIHDVASRYPEIVKALIHEYSQWEQQYKVILFDQLVQMRKIKE